MHLISKVARKTRMQQLGAAQFKRLSWNTVDSDMQGAAPQPHAFSHSG
jgi:hypothetical protein